MFKFPFIIIKYLATHVSAMQKKDTDEQERKKQDMKRRHVMHAFSYWNKCGHCALFGDKQCTCAAGVHFQYAHVQTSILSRKIDSAIPMAAHELGFFEGFQLTALAVRVFDSGFLQSHVAGVEAMKSGGLGYLP